MRSFLPIYLVFAQYKTIKKKAEQILFCSVNPYSNPTYSVYKRPTYIGGLSLMSRQIETL